MLRVIRSILRKAIRLFSGHGFWRFYPTRVAFKFLEPRLKSNVADVQEHKMFLDSKDSLDLSIFGLYEKLETQLVKKEIWMGDVVLDIGANIGYYTLIFAKLVGENGKVYAFEPDPTNFALLEKNVKTNGYENVILEQKAISNKNGKVKLYLGEDNKASHTIFDTHDNRQSIEIEAIRLDDYFKNYDGGIDFIKMDIEGAEGYAIQGMALLLRKTKKNKNFDRIFSLRA